MEEDEATKTIRQLLALTRQTHLEAVDKRGTQVVELEKHDVYFFQRGHVGRGP
jgi:hypothetical protein